MKAPPERRPRQRAETCLFLAVWLSTLTLMHHCFSSPCTAQAVSWKSPDVREPGPGQLLAPSSHTPWSCLRQGLLSLWRCSPRYGQDAAAALGEASPQLPPSPQGIHTRASQWDVGLRPKSWDMRLSTWHPLSKACDRKEPACFLQPPAQAPGL